MKRIKRFLKSISDEVKDSKSTNSTYYTITRDKYTITIRLSDHFSDSDNNYTINIIVNSFNIVVFKTTGFSIIENIEDFMPMLKAFFLLYPYLVCTINGYSNAIKEFNREKSDLITKNTRLLKVSDVNYAIKVLEENSNIKEELKTVKKKLEENTKATEELKVITKKLKNANAKVINLNSRLKVIKDAFNNIYKTVNK